MNRIRRTLVIFVVLTVAGTVCCLLWPQEPVYHNRTLSAWLQDLVEVDYRGGAGAISEADQVRREQAIEAIREIGPNSVPWLLRWISSSPERASVRDKLQALIEKLDWFKLKLPERRDRSAIAVAGFRVLGPAATNALPALGRRLLDRGHSHAVIECLCAIGPVAFPEVLRAVTNSQPNVQSAAVLYLTELGCQIGPAVLPVFVNVVTNRLCTARSQSDALRGLGDLGPIARELTPWVESIMRDPKHPLAGAAMPILAELSDKPEQYVPFFSERLLDGSLAQHAAFALSQSGPDGVSPLLQALTNANPMIANPAFVALGGFVTVRQAIGPPADRFSIRSLRFEAQCRTRTLATSLKRTPDPAAAAVPLRLTALLGHPEPNVRLQVVQWLHGFGRHAAVGLSRAAQDRNEAVHTAAEQALAGLDVEIKDGAIVRGPKDKRQIALVFTGHEYAEGAETILDELAKHRAEASFFVTGVFLTNAAFHPVLERLYREGHYLGPHSDRHLLYCSWEDPEKTLVTEAQLESDLAENLTKLTRLGVHCDPWPRYFVPPFEHYNLDVVQWGYGLGVITVNLTPGTRSAADYTGEADRNFVSSQEILDSIVARDRLDARGLKGFILLFHLGVGPGRTDKFHARLGELLDYLAGREYQFVAIDELLDPEAAVPRRARQRETSLAFDEYARLEAIMKAIRKRYGLDR
jgi:peptidoglycan/xylan/chitin deacetylase (PgdA/CDA1 family)